MSKTDKVWELNQEERETLHQRTVRKMGATKLLAELQQLKGLEIYQESAWWETLVLRLHIPIEYRYRLVADHTIGKVWVKGEVPELDAKLAVEPKRICDSPAY